MSEPAKIERIKVQARTIYAVSDDAKSGCLLPGNGNEEWFQDHRLGPQMVIVPPGAYIMGGIPDEEGRQETEEPQHLVSIAKPFAVGRFTVTVREFTTFVKATGHTMPDKIYTLEDGAIKNRKGYSFRNPGFTQSPQHPVVGVSWEDATAYCKWLTMQSGKEYSLLSESQWEYCCRAGTNTAFWWGDEISTKQANYNGNHIYGNGSKGQYRQQTLSVESFTPNRWGLYQMNGNVWEWCNDTWHDNYCDAPEDGSVWQGNNILRRVIRGGSWYNYPLVLRSSFRYRNRPDVRSSYLGFRACRTL